LKGPRTAKTDASGRYEITNLPEGRYNVTANKANFVPAVFGQRRPMAPGLPFDLKAGQVAERVDFSLARAGSIAGRVVDEFGDPVAEVQVSTSRYQYVNGERRLMPGQGRGMTNDLGEFRLFGLTPGEYLVSATVRDFALADGDDRSGYAPTYYPGTGNPAAAQAIAIAAGQSVAGVTLPLMPVRTQRVSGLALDASGKPMTTAMVVALARDRGPGTFSASGQIKPDGRFTIAGLPPGDYVLRVGAPDGETAVTTITVGDGDVTDVQLLAQRKVRVAGRAVFDGHRDLPKGLRVNVLQAEPFIAGSASAAADDKFAFETKVDPGAVFIRAGSDSPDWRMSRVIVNGVDVIDSGIDISPNVGAADVILQFTDRFPALSGTVTDDAEHVVQDCWIIAFSQDPRRWSQPHTRYVMPIRPGVRSRYQLRPPPGEYFVIALDDVENGQWNDPGFLLRAQAQATRVSVALGETKTLDLNLSVLR
jgi:hypothetical protein